MKRLGVFVLYLLFLVSCSTPASPPLPINENFFGDADIDRAVLELAASTEDISPPENVTELSVPLGEGSPTEAVAGDLNTQAVLPGVDGFIYYIRHETGIANPWSVERVNQANDLKSTVYAGQREIQSLGGSLDGNTVVLSMRESMSTTSDYELYRLNVSTKVVQQLTSDTVDNSNVSMSANGAIVAWQQPDSGVSAIFFRSYSGTAFSQKRLAYPTPSREPAVSSNGKYLVYAHDRPTGQDQLWRYDIQTNEYKAIYSYPTILGHPSVTDDGNRIMFLVTDPSSQDIQYIDLTTNKRVSTVYATRTLEHPSISADGNFLTYGYSSQPRTSPATGMTVYAKNIATGQLVAVRFATSSVFQKGMVWQKPNAATLRLFGNVQKVAPQNISIPSEFDGDIRFGNSLDLDGNVAVVGAPFVSYDADRDGKVECVFNAERSECYLGWAYILERDTQGKWSIVKQLETSQKQNTAEYDAFGTGVAVSGNTVVVTSRIQRDANGDGTFDSFLVHVYERNQGGTNAWGLSKTVLATNSLPEAVSLERDTLLIGEFVYERNQGGVNNWGRIKGLRQATPDAVALSGDTIIIGYRFEGVDINEDGTIDCKSTGGFPGTECEVGAAYIYGRNVGGTNNWGLVQRITASDALPFSSENRDHFGNAVDVKDDIIVVGNERTDPNADGVFDGGAYVFERNATTNVWRETQKITTMDKFDRFYGIFGKSVSIGDNTIAVGSLSSLEPGSGESVYIYTRSAGSNTWTQAQKLVDTDGGSQVGQGPVVLSGNTLGVGDFGSLNSNGKATGAVFFYER